jgi:hypothetical protein
MYRTLPKPLRTTLIAIVAAVVIAALLALIFLAVAPWFPDQIGRGRIQWDDHSVTLASAFSGGFFEFVFAFSVLTLAFLMAAVAVIFAFAVTVIALTMTAGALILAAAVVGLPFLIIVGIIWWSIRRSKPRASELGAVA